MAPMSDWLVKATVGDSETESERSNENKLQTGERSTPRCRT